MKEKKVILKVGDNDMTLDDVADIFGMSDSDDSDWGDIKEVNADDFLVEPTPKEVVKVQRVVEKKIIKVTEKIKPVINSEKEIKRKVIEKSTYFLAAPTKVRVMNPRLSIETWKERIMGRKVVPASDLCIGNAAERLVDTDWILVGVVVQKSGTKRTKTEKNYSTWMINDLQCLDKAVRFMLFGEVHNALWKECEGTVVAILRPKIMQSDKGYSEKSYTVDLAAQVIVLGLSPDYGTCTSMTKAGDKCMNVVNKTECGLCTYHVQQGYSAALNRPGFADIRREKLESRKRTAPKQDWNVTTKKLKGNGIFVNNAVGASLSLEKLHKGGVTENAAKWGLLDSAAVSMLGKGKENEVCLTESEVKFTTLLKKHGAGSKNLVKCIAEKSDNASVLADNVIKKGRVFDNSRPTVAKDVTFQSILERMKGRDIKRDDPQKYIDLDMTPVQLDKVSGEVYRAELNKLRASALAKSQGGYVQMKQNMMTEHLKNAGKPKESIAAAKTKAPLSEELLKLLHKGSSHSTLADYDKDIERDKKLDNLEKIEKMEIKMSSTHEQVCNYYYCNQCKTKSLGNPTICVLEGHKVDREKGHKRFFACLKCKHRLITLEKYPDQSCYKCGASVFEKAGMSKGSEVTANNKVSIDGGEKRFINN